MKKSENDELLNKYFSIIFDEKIAGMNRTNPDMVEAAGLITKIINFLRLELK